MSSNYYKYITKNGSLNSLKTTDQDAYNSAEYGTEFTSSVTVSSSIGISFYDETNGYNINKRRIYALKNTLNSYSNISPHYVYSSSYGDKSNQKIKFINIPSVFYGSSIDKGSIEIDFYISGTLLAKLEDVNKNGELIQTYGSNGNGNVAGVVLYNEGFILLTGSWDLHDSFTESYLYQTSNILVDKPKWIYWGAGLYENPNYTVSSSFDLIFEGVNYIHTMTMMAHAEKGEMNHSNNPTYLKYDQSVNISASVSPVIYEEYDKNEIKNTLKYEYENYVGNLEKQTYISKIGIYDENKNLIAIAKLAKPIRKTENRDITFKLKLDL